MKTIEQRERVYRGAIETFGINATLMTFIQEVSKMIITCARFSRRPTNPHDLTSQIAVLMNMMGQITYYLDNRVETEQKRDDLLDNLIAKIEAVRSRGGLGVRSYASRYTDTTR